MDGTKIFDKLTQLSNLEYEIFGKDNHKYNIIRYFDKIHSEKDNCILKIKELHEEINIIKEKHRECKERIEELKNELKSKSVKTCSKCGESGHNKKTCKKNP